MLVVFDWDGTLSDSTGRIVEAMQRAARQCGLPVPGTESVRDIIGLGLPEAVNRLFPGVEASDADRLRGAYSEHYRDLDRVPSELFPGALDTLAALRGRGYRLAVATGKSRRGLERVLEGLELGGFFDATRCADETRSKPHPMMLHELLRELGAVPQEAALVGDTEFDLAMARAAGLAGVGVSYGVHTADRLLCHHPLAIIDRLPELLELPLPAAGGRTQGIEAERPEQRTERDQR